MKQIESKTLAITAVVIAVALFVAVNVVANAWLGNVRADLTQGRAYSTSDQIKPVFANIGEPITVRVYYSRSIGDVSPRHAVYYQRVRDLLLQYAKLANGKLKVEFYNPEPFSDIEDRAVGFGLQGIPLSQSGEVSYFGLAASNSTDDEQIIPFFNLEREQFLEYDLTKLIYSLSEPNRPKIGLISSLPVNAGPQRNMTQGAATGPQAWVVMQQIKDFYTVVDLTPAITEVPKDVGILLLIQPDNLTEAAQRAIDQFVLRGGRAFVFVDPNAESATPPGGGGLQQMPRNADLSGIKKLMTAWGVGFDDKKVVGDRESAMRVNISTGARPVVSDYVAWMQLRKANFDSQDAATGDLRQVNFGTAGALDKVEAAGTTVTPLITTGAASMRMDAEKFVDMPDVVALFRDFQPQGKREIVAARITGKAKSAFAAPAGGASDFLSEAKDSIQVVVVSDTDVLTDRFWTESNAFLGQQVVVPTADNGNFVINIIENLSGSPALSSLRGRGVQSRPFVLVDRIRREAETQYRAKERALTGRLDELEKKVRAMQPKSDAKGAVVLSEQDKKTIENYRSDILATRRELRDVQRALREDIDGLEGVIKFVNIGAVPILFGLILIVAAGVRHRRRRRRAVEAQA